MSIKHRDEDLESHRNDQTPTSFMEQCSSSYGTSMLKYGLPTRICTRQEPAQSLSAAVCVLQTRSRTGTVSRVAMQRTVSQRRGNRG